eukprot:scaffold655_cov379-Prasinococcus_capsulatus_cf.AAC.4
MTASHGCWPAQSCFPPLMAWSRASAASTSVGKTPCAKAHSSSYWGMTYSGLEPVNARPANTERWQFRLIRSVRSPSWIACTVADCVLVAINAACIPPLVPLTRNHVCLAPKARAARPCDSPITPVALDNMSKPSSSVRSCLRAVSPMTWRPSGGTPRPLLWPGT